MTAPIQLTPIEIYLRVSAASVGAGETPPNTNHGPYPRRVLARTGNKEGDAWCAAQVTDWGVIALGAAWPCAQTAGVMALCAWAEQAKVRYVPNAAQDARGKPRVGDLYVLWSPEHKRWAHVGVIIEVGAGLAVKVRDGNTSLPGDTNPETQREGWLVAEKWRTLTIKDRLIRWVDAMLPE